MKKKAAKGELTDEGLASMLRIDVRNLHKYSKLSDAGTWEAFGANHPDRELYREVMRRLFKLSRTHPVDEHDWLRTYDATKQGKAG
jgi:hypothetical protein